MARQKKKNIDNNEKPKRKVGRPKAKILGSQVKMLAQYGMNNTEIAEYFGVNETTIRNNFSEFLTKGRTEQKYKLRRKQFQVAMKGNVIMLIWLGKQMLGQADKVETKSQIGIEVERTEIGFINGEEVKIEEVKKLEEKKAKELAKKKANKNKIQNRKSKTK